MVYERLRRAIGQVQVASSNLRPADAELALCAVRHNRQVWLCVVHNPGLAQQRRLTNDDRAAGMQPLLHAGDGHLRGAISVDKHARIGRRPAVHQVLRYGLAASLDHAEVWHVAGDIHVPHHAQQRRRRVKIRHAVLVHPRRQVRPQHLDLIAHGYNGSTEGKRHVDVLDAGIKRQGRRLAEATGVIQPHGGEEL